MAHDELPHDVLMARLTEMARSALPVYGLHTGSAVTMINHSENTTFRIDDPDGGVPMILRIHRNDYHTRTGIACELAWMTALREEAGITTPTPIPSAGGTIIETLTAPGLRDRHCVLFEFLAGREPDEADLIGPFHTLGAIAARMHLHSMGWTRPDDFERLHWDFEHMLGATPYWGDWHDGLALTPERVALLERLSATLRRRLDAFGQGPERFGLVHADLRLANLLIDGDHTKVIDFDDSGLSWFLYDLASALSFMEERPDIPDLVTSWVAGYETVRPLPDADKQEIPTFLMLRRLLILAWIGSHSQTDLALDLGPEYTAGTCRLAEIYLAEFER